MTVVESNVYGLWAAKQSAKGSTIAGVAATKAMIQVAGDFSTNRDDGSEVWSDLARFGDQTDFVNTLVGGGNPGIEAQPTTLAYLNWLFFGQETVTGAGDPYTHSSSPGTNGGFWSTWWVRVGQNVIRREKFGDCRIGSLVLEGSTGSKIVRATPTIISLNPGITYTSPDPSAAIDILEAQEPFRYTEGRGAYSVNGGILNGQSQFTVTWDENLGPYYGDDVTPLDLVPGTASIGCAVTILADSAGVQEYNKRIYGSASPAPGTAPLKDLESLGAYTFTLTRRNASGALTPARDLVLTIPGVRWAPDVALPPNPDGGAIEISLGGSMRKVTGQNASTVAIRNGDAAYTA
jgi:hypothetical protein